MPEYVPNTIVRVLKDVPLDATYSDTIWFTSSGAQTSFFAGKAKYSYSNMTYQRVNNSVAMPRIAQSVRVPQVADDLYDCNYIMFQNSNYGQKWFYAFISQVNYINPENTEIIYVIDYFQTFMFEFEVLPSFVEREHPNSDGLFEHLLPEPVGEPDMYTQAIHDCPLQTGPANIVVGVSTDPAGQTVAGEMVAGMYTGVQLNTFNSADAATAFIREYDDKAKAEAIVCVFMCPWNTLAGVPLTRVSISNPSNLNGYTPKNKKLLSYPYCKLTMSNRQGENFDFYYEYFGTPNQNGGMNPGSPGFNYGADGGVQPYGYCVAVGYNGWQGQPNMDYDKVGEISGLPQCAWTSDAFANWLAGQGTASAVKLLGNFALDTFKNSIGTAAAGFGQLASGNVMGAVATGASGIGNALGNLGDLASGAMDLGIEAWTRSKCPGLAKGTSHLPNLNMNYNALGFTIKEMAITPEVAKTIDDFFDMFGYATNRVKVPNMTGRESWNYVKTKNVIIKGSVPVQGMSIIKRAFNNGIRLWHGDFVGNYARSNRPLSEVYQ